ncbi:MAG: hypothetical protein DMG78_21835 [Acidobacteria bacterium]|nr:MAG: hypothetical protein DMG78_21835 [Acidobacteriota bacterium]
MGALFSMASAAFWSGKHRPADIRKNQRDCCLWIRNWFVIRMTGIAEVAQVVFVRKLLVEVQYLRTVITDEQREEFGRRWRARSGESSRRTFCRTVESAFPGIPVAAVRM